MASLTGDDVASLAALARIELTADERDRFATDLDSILQAVAQLSESVGDDVPATSHPMPLTNVTRADEIRPGLSTDAALAGAPAAEQSRFRVPRILGEE